MMRKVFPKGTNSQKSSCLSPSVILFHISPLIQVLFHISWVTPSRFAFHHWEVLINIVIQFSFFFTVLHRRHKSKYFCWNDKQCKSWSKRSRHFFDLQQIILLHIAKRKLNFAAAMVHDFSTLTNWQQCFRKILRRVLCLTMPVKSIWDKNIVCQQIFLYNTKFCPERLFKKNMLCIDSSCSFSY